MKFNLGSADRIARIIIAIVIAVLFFTNIISGIPGIVLLIVAGLLAMTGFAGFCPLYALFKIHTNKKPE